MTEPHKAKLAFLSQPAPAVYLLNLQFENGANLVVEISASQLGNIVVDGARMALRGPRAMGVEK